MAETTTLDDLLLVWAEDRARLLRVQEQQTTWRGRISWGEANQAAFDIERKAFAAIQKLFVGGHVYDPENMICPQCAAIRSSTPTGD